MNSLLRNCGLAALVVSATCLTLTTAEAGGRRNCYHNSNQSYYAAPATTAYAAPAMVTTTDGRQRYQSTYQAPAMPANTYYGSGNGYYQAPANNYVYGSGHLGGGMPLNFQNRSFHDQWDAGRKIRGW
ncbi:MAG: hypothetical protein JWN70_2760 [Planctomycetaceae bacterium]|nr:hypothetical protein [Planctomycetaceae bacterium]